MITMMMKSKEMQPMDKSGKKTSSKGKMMKGGKAMKPAGKQQKMSMGKAKKGY